MALLAFELFPVFAIAQDAEAPVAADPSEPATIQLTFPSETELRVLVDFIGRRLGIKFLYDEQVTNKRISIKAAEPIPLDSVMDVLQSALKMKGLAVVDAEVKGWKRIVMVEQLPQIAVPQDDESTEGISGTTAVTQSFALKYHSPEVVGQIIEPFLTKQGANTIKLPSQKLLIVTDYAHNLKRITQLIKTIDRPGPERVVKFYPVRHVEVAELSQQITQSLTSKSPAEGSGQRVAQVAHDSRTNQLIIVGTEEQIEEALELVERLDVDLGHETKVYAFKNVSAERIDRLAQEIIGPETVKRLYRSAIDDEENLLIVTTTASIHDRVRWLRDELDIEAKRMPSAVQFYRIKYADAQDVLNTLRSIAQRPGNSSSNNDPSVAGRRGVSELGREVDAKEVSGPQEPNTNFLNGPNNLPKPETDSPEGATTEIPSDGANTKQITPHLESSATAGIVPGGASISVDPNSNAIIVIADREVQQMYADLIETLDRRRPQVMIEAKVVILDTTNNFSFGVEISGGLRGGATQLMQFTAFGLSQANPVTGALAITPGRGLNWALVDPDSAHIVLRALSQHSRAKVVSAPRILVNDNATGTLASVTEVPFTSVNASSTVATTSFAGFAEAGTTIEATPRISGEGYLQLEFNVTLNSFTGAGSDGVPPPRQTDQINSSVTIPDGYTVIAGGLTRSNAAESKDGLPIIEHIPVLRAITGLKSKSKSQSTLFVFLRPVILQEDKFADLKFLSDRDLCHSTEPGNYPVSKPLIVK